LEPEKRMINEGVDIIGERIYWEQGKVEKSIYVVFAVQLYTN